MWFKLLNHIIQLYKNLVFTENRMCSESSNSVNGLVFANLNELINT